MSIKKMKRGFTLIELMIVVAIIGILAAIAIPKFSDLVTKSNEATTKGNLGAIRSALSIYYGDMEGWYPQDDLSVLAVGNKYMSTIPVAKLPAKTGFNIGHADTSLVTPTTGVGDTAGWAYDNTTTDTNWGRLLTACSHKDTRGNLWTTY
jgi:prepilin-type N-terminal cleavage/methylation domain-containing protein